MPSVSVIERELREAARQPQTYWLRVAGVAAAILVLGLTTAFVSGANSPTESARWLFVNLQTLVFVSIWVVVPFLTGDALSRERREGTLGLLFLTPLRPFEVVLGKGMAQAVRTTSLLLGVVPVMSVPLLLGGLSVQEVWLALTADLMSLALALAAGLLASSFSRQFMRAMAASVAVTGLCFIGLGVTYHGILSGVGGAPRVWAWEARLWTGLALLSGAGDSWQQWGFLRAVPRGAAAGFGLDEWCAVNATLLVAILGVAAAMLALAAYRTRRTAMDSAAGLLPARLDQMLTRPVLWTGWLRTHMRRSLSRNPVGWLHERRAWSRVVKWGWCAVVAVVCSLLVSVGSYYALPQAFALLAAGLVAGLAFTAGSSFRSEQESGLLELLLVTPIDEWQVILGRLRSLWSQFLPSVALVAGPLLYLRSTRTWIYSAGAMSCETTFWCLVSSLVFVPCIGLAMSVRRLGAVSAWMGTLFFGVVAPLVAGSILCLFLRTTYLWPVFTGNAYSTRDWVVAVVSVQAVSGAVCLVGLFHRLRTRRFLAP